MHKKLKELLKEIWKETLLEVRIASTQLYAEPKNTKYWLTSIEYISETFILHGTPSESTESLYDDGIDVYTVEEVIDFLDKHNYDYPKASNVKLEFNRTSDGDDYWLYNGWDVNPTVEVNDDDIVIYGWVADKKANAVWDRHAKMYKPYSWLSKGRLIGLLENEGTLHKGEF